MPGSCKCCRDDELRRSAGFEAARRLVLTNRGKDAMDAIRQLITAMSDAEQIRLQQLEESIAANTRGTILAFSGLALLAGTLLGTKSTTSCAAI